MTPVFFFPILVTFPFSVLMLSTFRETLGWNGKKFRLDNLDLSLVSATYQVNDLEYQLTFYVIVSASSSAKQE